jgi:hypothetical protein
MGKQESIEATREAGDTKIPPADEARATLVPGDGMDADEATRNALAAIEALKIETPNGESTRIELSDLAAPKIDGAAEEIRPESADMPEPDLGVHDEMPEEQPHRRISPFAMMAASLGGAAAFGAMLGALIATGIARPTPVAAVTAPKIGIEELNALKEQVVQARVELAQLKTSIEAGHRGANQQFTKINERVEKMERTQAEPVARLAKAVEALDRFGRHEAAKEATGSITPPQPIAHPSKGVEGWVVREVKRGTAFIEGRMGIIEVDQGDIVPGLGRVDAIRKQDGRWVVITSRGVIHQAR